MSCNLPPLSSLGYALAVPPRLPLVGSSRSTSMPALLEQHLLTLVCCLAIAGSAQRHRCSEILRESARGVRELVGALQRARMLRIVGTP